MSSAGRGGGEGPRTRDHLANVRTMLAWLRVSVALLTVGYSLDHLGALQVASHVAAVNSYRLYGIGSAGAGTLVAAGALLRYLWQRRAIEGGVFRTALAADIILVALVGLGGVALIAAIATVR